MKLKLGPVVHGVLLVAVLLFAYSSWTREEKVESKVGKVDVWSKGKDSVQSIQIYSKDKRGVEKNISIAKTAEGYIWGSDKRSRPKRRRRKPGDDPDKQPEMITMTNDFVGGDAAEEAFEHFAELKALHGMGKLGEEKIKEYGLEDDDTVSIQFKGGDKTRTLIVGKVVFGSTNRYVLDVDTGKGYILASAVIDPLLKGMSKLKLRKLHKFKDDDLSKVVMDTGKQSRTLIRSTVERNKRKVRTWTDEKTPNQPDSTSNNFLNRIKRLAPTKFDKEVKAAELEGPLVKIAYYDKSGKKVGWFELYKKEPEPEPEEDEEGKDGADDKDGADKKGDADKKDGTTKAPAKKAPAKVAPKKKAPAKKGVGAGKKKTPGFEQLANQPTSPATKKPAAKKPAAKKPVKKAAAKKPAVKKAAAGKGKKPDPKKAGADKDKPDPKKITLRKPPKRKKPTLYYVKTERTHVFARVPTRAAARIEEDLKDLYDLGKSRTKRPPGKRHPGLRTAPKGFKVPKRPKAPPRRPGMRRPGRRGPHGMKRPGRRMPPGLPGRLKGKTLKKGAKPGVKVKPRTPPKPKAVPKTAPKK